MKQPLRWIPRFRFLFQNPLLKRELIALLRTRRAFWLLVVVVAMSSLFPLFAWPSSHEAITAYDRTLGTFLTFTMTQLATALLIIPAFTAGAFAGERERSTYELLYTSLLSPLSIVFAKWLASVGYVLILLLASMPTICLLYLQGGIDFEMVIQAYAVILAAVIFAGLICLTTSIRSRRTLHAILRGVCWVILWNGGFLYLGLLFFVVIQGVLFGDVDVDGSWAVILIGLCPVPAMVFVVFPPSLGGIVSIAPAYMYVVYAGALSALHLVYLIWKVRWPDAGSPFAWVGWIQRQLAAPSATRRRRVGPAPRSVPVAVRRRRPIQRPLLTQILTALGEVGVPLLGNPVFLKEIRSEFFGRLWYRRLVFFTALGVLVLISWIPEADFSDRYMSMGIVMLLGLSLLMPGVMATSIPREVDQGNLDLLRGTLLPLWRVLFGKVLAGIYSVSGILMAFGLTAVVFPVWCLLTGSISYRGDDGTVFQKAAYVGVVFLLTVIVVPLTVLFLAAFSSFFAVLFRRTMGALLGAYAALVAFFVGLPLFIGFLTDFPSDLLMELTFGLNPFLTWGFCLDTYYREIVRNWNSSNNPTVTLVFFAILYPFLTILLTVASGALLYARHERDT